MDICFVGCVKVGQIVVKLYIRADTVVVFQLSQFIHGVCICTLIKGKDCVRID